MYCNQVETSSVLVKVGVVSDVYVRSVRSDLKR